MQSQLWESIVLRFLPTRLAELKNRLNTPTKEIWGNENSFPGWSLYSLFWANTWVLPFKMLTFHILRQFNFRQSNYSVTSMNAWKMYVLSAHYCIMYNKKQKSAPKFISRGLSKEWNTMQTVKGEWGSPTRNAVGSKNRSKHSLAWSHFCRMIITVKICIGNNPEDCIGAGEALRGRY